MHEINDKVTYDVSHCKFYSVDSQQLKVSDYSIHMAQLQGDHTILYSLKKALREGWTTPSIMLGT